MKAFIDLDGTLLDSTKRHTILLNQILRHYNINADISDYLEYKRSGNSTKSYLINRLKLKEIDADKITKDWANNIENPELLTADIWYEDSALFLKQLKSLGYKRILLTARQNSDYVNKLIVNSPNIELDEIYVVTPFNAEKEKAEILNINKAQNIIMIGDTEVDYNAAKKTKIKSYNLSRGFRNDLFWQKRGIQSFSDLSKIIVAIIKNLEINN